MKIEIKTLNPPPLLGPGYHSPIAACIVKYFGTDKSTTKITINRTEVEYSEGDIVRVIEETRKIEYE